MQSYDHFSMTFWYNTAMPSKYMSERLARVPFRQPPPSQNSLHHEFLADIDFARANTISGLGQEGRAWQQLATNALSRVASKEAKAYVWNQFAQAQNPLDEPALFMAGYTWLAANASFAPARNTAFLDWQNDGTHKLASLLAATTHLPEPKAIAYLAAWLSTQQTVLACAQLPVHRIRMSLDEDEYGFYDESPLGYTNLIVWAHILPNLLQHLNVDDADFAKPPYLPFAFEFSFVDQLLPKLPAAAQAWLLSNALFAGDISVAKINVVEQTNTMKGLSRLVGGLDCKKAKAFAVWDMVQRQSHDEGAARLLQEHVPEVHALLDGVGLLECASILQALHHRWAPPGPEESLALPDGVVPSEQWIGTP